MGQEVCWGLVHDFAEQQFRAKRRQKEGIKMTDIITILTQHGFVIGTVTMACVIFFIWWALLKVVNDPIQRRFNRNLFLTLNEKKLFTAKEVADLIELYEGE